MDLSGNVVEEMYADVTREQLVVSDGSDHSERADVTVRSLAQ